MLEALSLPWSEVNGCEGSDAFTEAEPWFTWHRMLSLPSGLLASSLFTLQSLCCHTDLNKESDLVTPLLKNFQRLPVVSRKK